MLGAGAGQGSNTKVVGKHESAKIEGVETPVTETIAVAMTRRCRLVGGGGRCCRGRDTSWWD